MYLPELELDVDADGDEGGDATDCEALAAATLMVMGIEGDISDRAELRAEEACESARRRRGREAEWRSTSQRRCIYTHSQLRFGGVVARHKRQNCLIQPAG
jgi:hypothetical protein